VAGQVEVMRSVGYAGVGDYFLEAALTSIIIDRIPVIRRLLYLIIECWLQFSLDHDIFLD